MTRGLPRWMAWLATWRHRDASHAIAMAMIRSLGRLALAATLARITAPDAFAGFIVLVAIETILLSMIAARFASAAASLVPGRAPDEQRAIISRVVAGQTSASRCGAVLIVLAAPALSRIGVAPIDTIACAVAMAAIGSHLAARSSGLSLFRARGLLAGELIVALGGIAGAGVAGRLSGHAVAGAWLGVAIASWVAGRQARRCIADRLQTGSSAAVARSSDGDRIAALGRPMLLGSVAYSAGGRLQPMIVAAVLDLAGVAALGVASTVAGPLRMVTGAIASIVHPRVAERHSTGTPAAQRRFAWMVLGGIAGGGVAVTIGVALVAGPVITVVFGASYTAAASLAVWACGHAALAAVASAHTAIVQGRGDARTPTVARIVATIVTLSITVPLLLRLGPTGAFVALIAGECVFLMLTLPARAAPASAAWLRPRRQRPEAHRTDQVTAPASAAGSP